MVARDRIELPTRGFSVRRNLHPAGPNSTRNNLLRKWPLGRFSSVLLGDAGSGTKVETRVSRPSSPRYTECLFSALLWNQWIPRQKDNTLNADGSKSRVFAQ